MNASFSITKILQHATTACEKSAGCFDFFLLAPTLVWLGTIVRVLQVSLQGKLSTRSFSWVRVEMKAGILSFLAGLRAHKESSSSIRGRLIPVASRATFHLGA